MQLSPELFAKLTGGPVPAPGGLGPAERRQYGRVQLGRRAQVRVADEAWQTVLVRDVSVVGVGFQSDGRLPPGARFTLRLTGADGEVACLPCVVHRCEAGGLGGVAFFVGSTFDDAEPDAAARPIAAGRPRSFLARVRRRLSIR